MKSNLFLRIVSSLILGPIVLAMIVRGDCAFNILIAIIGCLMSIEWEQMVRGKESWIASCLTLMSGLIICCMQFNTLVSIMVIPVCALFLYLKTNRNFLLSFGAFYIGIPILSLMYIAYFTDSGSDDLSYSSMYILWLLFVVWSADIGGYVVGKSIGGPKLCPKISPTKTWAGLFGGIIFSAVTTYIFVLTMNHYHGSQLEMKFLVSSSVGLALVAQMGDLFESKIKRHLDIKDSGTLIPGHGGIFDRVDGLLFAAPAVALFVLLVNMGYIK